MRTRCVECRPDLLRQRGCQGADRDWYAGRRIANNRLSRDLGFGVPGIRGFLQANRRGSAVDATTKLTPVAGFDRLARRWTDFRGGGAVFRCSVAGISKGLTLMIVGSYISIPLPVPNGRLRGRLGPVFFRNAPARGSGTTSSVHCAKTTSLKQEQKILSVSRTPRSDHSRLTQRATSQTAQLSLWRYTEIEA